jgi:hypothetical protein
MNVKKITCSYRGFLFPLLHHQIWLHLFQKGLLSTPRILYVCPLPSLQFSTSI